MFLDFIDQFHFHLQDTFEQLGGYKSETYTIDTYFTLSYLVQYFRRSFNEKQFPSRDKIKNLCNELLKFDTESNL